MLNIHKHIEEKLNSFIQNNKIPNILFHGGAGSGKKTIVSNFIKKIYNNDISNIQSFVLYVNCSHCKGIRFIREDLKFFAKTHINSNSGLRFKSIVLLNADKLTVDAQSALRRSIEVFSNTTRVFMIVEDKYKLLKPILSRFCEICIHNPIIDGQVINLYKYNVEHTYNCDKYALRKQQVLCEELSPFETKFKDDVPIIIDEIVILSEKLYNLGYSANDLISYFHKSQENDFRHLQMILSFNKMKNEFRNEKLAMMFCLTFEFISSNEEMGNISVM